MGCKNESTCVCVCAFPCLSTVGLLDPKNTTSWQGQPVDRCLCDEGYSQQAAACGCLQRGRVGRATVHRLYPPIASLTQISSGMLSGPEGTFLLSLFLIAMASNLRAVASSLEAMASNLIVMASNSIIKACFMIFLICCPMPSGSLEVPTLVQSTGHT